MPIFSKSFLYFLCLSFVVLTIFSARVEAEEMACLPVHDIVNSHDTNLSSTVTPPQKPYGRTICADVVALDQMLVYNRFGSFNPFGMIYALRRDVVPLDQKPERISADSCDADTGTDVNAQALSAGNVRLKDCKRPRPLVLRANVGDILHVRMDNLLMQSQPDLSTDFCDKGISDPRGNGHEFATIRNAVSEGSDTQVDHGEALCEADKSSKPDGDHNWPMTRGLNFAVQGLTVIGIDTDLKTVTEPHRACLGLETIAPGVAVNCYYRVEREGPFFLASTAAPSGGQGDGGSITHGLFGAITVENKGTKWFRSQVSNGTFRAVWPEGQMRHSVSDVGDLSTYEKLAPTGVPYLAMLKDRKEATYELVHADLNAVVYTPEQEKTPATAFREFSVFFHDEIKAFYTRNFDELGDFGQLAGARDGFAVNYGASGMGTLLLANRKGIGPAANCAECFYEEFFLTSWANGDPSLLEHFSDDPSNVHHSYLNDAVVYRNFHAGPKETHVFHLHAHQWFAGNDEGKGSYLDSQTVGPQQGFSYNIYDGGMQVYHPGGSPGLPGWYETLGSGNRNRTVGDSIFHCHLYPHFAQGMWELWRVHDVLEDGSRKLPDGQWAAGFSIEETLDRGKKRPGSVDPVTGRWIDPGESNLAASKIGTPVPALVPLPGQAWPLLPTYPKEVAVLDRDSGAIAAEPLPEGAALEHFPGYPYYIAGKPGHRPPQPPMDLARGIDPGVVGAADDVLTAEYLDGGLPRHVLGDKTERKTYFDVSAAELVLNNPATPKDVKEAVQTQVVATALALGDMTLSIKKAEVALLEYDGTPLERTAMAFHADGAGLSLADALGNSVAQVPDTGAYTSVAISGPSEFGVNGAPPKPGAPFADPCGAPLKFGVQEANGDPMVRGLAQGPFAADPAVSGYRRYEGSAVQLNMVTNRAGWHDPQARINVLTKNSDTYKDPGALAADLTDLRIWSSTVSASEEPFFFRALSGECIEFRHTNELPHVLELDDFQVRTPTDTIGQHIHLVKFDVTSADGSANGFNYEDGTFAPDEIAHRICAAKNINPADVVQNRAAGELKIREYPGLCVEHDGVWHVSETYYDRIWRLQLGKYRELFQTTVQRWFADPILSEVADPVAVAAQVCDGRLTLALANGTPLLPPNELCDGAVPGVGSSPVISEVGKWWHTKATQEAVRVAFPGGLPIELRHDRTLRTVFSHDHFGPSSIQQHGFYTALVIEPPKSQTCEVEADAAEIGGVGQDCTALRTDRELIVAGDLDVGARKIIRDMMPIDPDTPEFREFAVAVADFALLYDPRNKADPEKLTASFGGVGASPYDKGMATLACEAQNRADPKRLKEVCGSGVGQDGPFWSAAKGEMPPAWAAAGRPDDDPAHTLGLVAGLPAAADVTLLVEHLVDWRRMAAGFRRSDGPFMLATPVSPPSRPESISVDHHDPYLINYRGEPLPLRLGSDSSAGSDCALKGVEYWVGQLTDGNGVDDRCEISRVKLGASGDPANVFLTDDAADGTAAMHGDPATPILGVGSNDPVQIRLIQGAQEVQHTFTLEGYTWTRNIDQAYPSVLPRSDDQMPRDTLVAACANHAPFGNQIKLVQAGRPSEYRRWMMKGPSGFAAGTPERTYWAEFEKQLHTCFNVEGRIAAQEIGISEHFEFRAAYLNDTNAEGVGESILFKSGRQINRQNFGSVLIKEIDALNVLLRKTKPSDTLVHFGSTDALWNGAWMLMRVSPDEKRVINPLLRTELLELRDELMRFDEFLSPDPQRQVSPGDIEQLGNLTRRRVDLQNRFEATDPETLDPPARRSIELLPQFRTQRGDTGAISRSDPNRWVPVLPLGQALDGPPTFQRKYGQKSEVTQPQLVARCDAAAPRVYTAVVAIEARSVFKNETEYSSSALIDPDGLFFALVDPRRLVAKRLGLVDPQSVTPAQLDDANSWIDLPLSLVIDEVDRVYDRPEPMVMTVRAGDCVHAVWINALRDVDRRLRLRDGVGDALMPGITSINVDTDWAMVETVHPDDGKQHAESWTSVGRPDVRPSSRLAVVFPLPMMNRQSTISRPFGTNPVWALDGAQAGSSTPSIKLTAADRPDLDQNQRRAQIMLTQFYAGRVFGSPTQKWRWERLTPLLSALQTSGFRTFSESLAAVGVDKVPEASAVLREMIEEDPGLRTRSADLGALENQEQVVAALTKLASSRSSVFADLQAKLKASGLRATLLEPRPLESLDHVEGLDRKPGSRADDQGRFIAEGRLWSYGLRMPAKLALELRLITKSGIYDLEGDIDLPLSDVAAAFRVSNPELAGTLDDTLAGIQANLVPFEIDLEFLIRIGPAQRLLVLASDLETRFVPYAFGALPVKSVGDVIGHGVHGLFGAITVVPRDAQISETRAPIVEMKKQREACLRPSALLPDDLRTAWKLLELPYFARGLPLAERGRPVLRGALVDWVNPRRVCKDFVLSPSETGTSDRPFWTSQIVTPDPNGKMHTIRQFTVFWQDGLNLHDRETKDQHDSNLLVTDCKVCDDTYDLGEKGVSYRSEPFNVRLRPTTPDPVETHMNLNGFDFGPEFFPLRPGEVGGPFEAPIPVLRAIEGEEITVHVVHPGGRARQRAFVTVALDYDDLFHGFGFPRGALLAPGKAITAQVLRKPVAGCYLWFDGPAQTRAGGTWGLIDVLSAADFKSPKESQCAQRLDRK
jgi:hypothetical protein